MNRSAKQWSTKTTHGYQRCLGIGQQLGEWSMQWRFDPGVWSSSLKGYGSRVKCLSRHLRDGKLGYTWPSLSTPLHERYTPVFVCLGPHKLLDINISVVSDDDPQEDLAEKYAQKPDTQSRNLAKMSGADWVREELWKHVKKNRRFSMGSKRLLSFEIQLAQHPMCRSCGLLVMSSSNFGPIVWPAQCQPITNPPACPF